MTGPEYLGASGTSKNDSGKGRSGDESTSRESEEDDSGESTSEDSDEESVPAEESMSAEEAEYFGFIVLLIFLLISAHFRNRKGRRHRSKMR